MTKRQIEAELRRWQKLLRLQDWVIELECIEADKINDDDDLANVRRKIYKDEATITTARKQDKGVIVGCVIHELLHIAIHPMRDLYDDVANALGLPAAKLFAARMDTLEERLIAKLESAFCRLAGE